MSKATISMPLICWKCLGKDVYVDADNNVICRNKNPWGGEEGLPKECGYKVTQAEWFDLVKGSLPNTGEEWTINVVLPKTARDKTPNEPQ